MVWVTRTPHTRVLSSSLLIEDSARQASELLLKAKLIEAQAIANQTQDVYTLAMEVVRAVIAQTSETMPELVLHTTKKALAKLRTHRNVVLLVNPADEAMINQRLSEIIPSSVRTTLEGFVIKTDELVSRGGVVVQSELGVINATIDSQLATIERSLRAGR